MGGFGHGNQNSGVMDDPRISARNSRFGMVLFLIYLAIYITFVVLNAYFPQQMETTPAFGVNLAILFGFSLIGAAMGLALVYCFLCRSNQISDLTKSPESPSKEDVSSK